MSCSCNRFEYFEANANKPANAPKNNNVNKKPINKPVNRPAQQMMGACEAFPSACSAPLARAAQPCCNQGSHECYCTEMGLGYHTLSTAYGN